MMDWLGQLVGLPPQFLACSGGTGGGVIQVLVFKSVVIISTVYYL